MDQILPALYKDYGQYSNYRNLPNEIDGCKPVEKRVLYSAYKIAREKFVKSRQVDAYTTGHYHPHGQTYGTIVQLVRQGFLTGQGNFGTNVGIEPIGAAADRYTECKLSRKILDLAFKYIKYVPFVETELNDIEPAYLPTMFPICLLGTEYTQGIGFGYRTFIPNYKINDLYQRLIWLLKIRKRKPIIAPITDCNIISKPDELEILLTKGKAKIEVEGNIEIAKRYSRVILKSWPYGKRFQALLNKFDKELSEKMIGFTDLSSNETKIIFQVLRERNRLKIFEDFILKLKENIKGFISFELNIVDSNQRVITKSVDKMLLDTYASYLNINKIMLQEEISKINIVIQEFNLLEKIKKPLIRCIGEKKSINTTFDIINKETGIEKKVIAALVEKYKIKKLLTLNTETTELKHKVNDLTDKLNNLSDFVLKQYEEICQ